MEVDAHHGPGLLIEGKDCGRVCHIRDGVDPEGRETLISRPPGSSFAIPARRGSTGRPSQHRHSFLTQKGPGATQKGTVVTLIRPILTQASVSCYVILGWISYKVA